MKEWVSVLLTCLVLCLSCIWSWHGPGRLSRDGSWLSTGWSSFDKDLLPAFLTSWLGHWLLPAFSLDGSLFPFSPRGGSSRQAGLGRWPRVVEAREGAWLSWAGDPESAPSRPLLTAALWKEQWTWNQEFLVGRQNFTTSLLCGHGRSLRWFTYT